MEPIVSPWLIYAIAKVDVICSVFVLAIILSACAFIFAFIAIVTEDYLSDKMEASIKKVKRISLVVFIISTLVLVLVPDSDTLYKMAGAYYLTPNNIQQAVDTINGYGK